jgi:hypothetical protein
MASKSVSDSAPVDIESTAKQPAAASDELSSQRFYHGTRAALKPGDLIEPGLRHTDNISVSVLRPPVLSQQVRYEGRKRT